MSVPDDARTIVLDDAIGVALGKVVMTPDADYWTANNPFELCWTEVGGHG